jgi:hypothetical protein
MTEDKIKRVPFVRLSAKLERDEYKKQYIESYYVEEVDTLYILQNTKNSNDHGLKFNSQTWVPQMKDKIYFMKGCTVPRVKLKDLAVKYKIRTTTDIDSATVVVGSDSAGYKLFNDGWHYTVSGKVFEAALEVLKEQAKDTPYDYQLHRIEELKNTVFDGEWPEYIYTDWNTAKLCRPDSYYPQEYVNTLYKKLNVKDGFELSKVYSTKNNSTWSRTINQDNLDLYREYEKHTIIEQSALLEVINGDESTSIDEDAYQNIRNMFNSSDSDNHTMAMEIMANCNYKGSMLYLLMLFFHCNNQINNSRSKNHVNFKSLRNYLDIDGYGLHHIDEVIKRLIENNSLNTEALDFIMDDQKEYFKTNGYSKYIIPQAYILNPDASEATGIKYKNNVVEFEDKHIETSATEEEIIEDTEEEVTVSEPDTAELTIQEDPEIEEDTVEIEEEVTEPAVAETPIVQKDEAEFDWF